MSERYQTSGKPGACIAAGLWTTVSAVAAAAVLGGFRIIGLYLMLLMPIVFALGVACSPGSTANVLHANIHDRGRPRA
ncbi:MAG: hypothetical protein ACI8W8_000226 [Rhodothermales bacterium]|jgi:hypothetical protein